MAHEQSLKHSQKQKQEQASNGTGNRTGKAVKSSNLGFPRIGDFRELKFAQEDYWAGRKSEAQLLEVSQQIRKKNWLDQQARGIDFIPSNDFSFYDQVLDATCMLGAIPARYGKHEKIDFETYFAMARGNADVTAMEMTKWFDTNYHYIVPELTKDMTFTNACHQAVDQFLEAKALGVHTRPVLLGPVSWLVLGKVIGQRIDKFELLDGILAIYKEVLLKLEAAGADWVQIDEPVLNLDLGDAERAALERAYEALAQGSKLKLLVATYFGELKENLGTLTSLPVSGIHVDLTRGNQAQLNLELDLITSNLNADQYLSLGVIDGRNIWKADLNKTLDKLDKVKTQVQPDKLIVAPGCSLLHSPVDLSFEFIDEQLAKLSKDVSRWFSFARQKLDEIVTLSIALNEGRDKVRRSLDENASDCEARRTSPLIHNKAVKDRAANVDAADFQRTNQFDQRREVQQGELNLPEFPTTTIGSFPQTQEIRSNRARYRTRELDELTYEARMKVEISKVIQFQEDAGIDVLVHGEPERNDMVEYFGEQLIGYAHTRFGWVQSYGSRCVKPPIIYGDIHRPQAMTVKWSSYAQSLTSQLVKGMLTGPVTMLQWSFVRDDQPRRDTTYQLALAIRDEVTDLEAAGLRVIQIDEPAFREGLPLRKADWEYYLDWAVSAFRLATSSVKDSTQIHTHMCYSEFNDIMTSIADLDADVISIETSRSQMELLEAFEDFKYPNEIGPGVYDIHSPRIPSVDEMTHLLGKATERLNPWQVWVNPDCGLKTRKWDEVKPALTNMVAAAQSLREASKAAPVAG